MQKHLMHITALFSILWYVAQCVMCIPLSQRELYWSVLMAVCFPSVRKMAESVPIKSMYTPA